jgi:hypothetical protein
MGLCQSGMDPRPIRKLVAYMYSLPIASRLIAMNREIIKTTAQHVAAGDLAKALRENVGDTFLLSC